MRSRVSALGPVLLLVLGLSGCGGGDSSSTTTLPPADATVFKTVPTTSTTLSPSSVADQGGAIGLITYTVKPNDTWVGIAKQFGCANYLELITYNDNKESIFPGDVINIPAACGQTPTEPTTAAGDSATQTTTTPTTTTEGDPNSASYTIEAGDTLSGIASKFDTTMNAIVSLNGWEGINHVLIPGKDIKVPVAGA